VVHVSVFAVQIDRCQRSYDLTAVVVPKVLKAIAEAVGLATSDALLEADLTMRRENDVGWRAE
jgi:hypothetical protein